jgi:L-aspartate oxidase
VRILVEEGTAAIDKLLQWGTQFTPSSQDSDYPHDLALEGGHSRHRILHSADRTGHEIERALLEKVRRNPMITLIEDCEALEMIVSKKACLGVHFWNFETQKSEPIYAQSTILATGGFGQLFEHTTNPYVSTGDGISLAYMAGAAVEDMEFVQFHPTGFAHPEAKGFLISEAVRGFGAHLLNQAGERFMVGLHHQAELAPRDIVARAIFAQIQNSQHHCVYLSLSHLDPVKVHEKFPHISKTCAKSGLDLAHDLIPVAPSAHYACGGIKTTKDGKSTLKRLYAIGEVACTGVHGANRLASNSLLEGIVFARRAVRHIEKFGLSLPYGLPLVHSYLKKEEQVDSALDRKIASIEKELREMMSLNCGIVRSKSEMSFALNKVYFWKNTFVPGRGLYHQKWFRLKHLLVCAELILRSALERKESKGLHFRSDSVENLSKNKRTTIYKSKTKF